MVTVFLSSRSTDASRGLQGSTTSKTPTAFGVRTDRFNQNGMHPDLFKNATLFYISPDKVAAKQRIQKKTVLEAMMAHLTTPVEQLEREKRRRMERVEAKVAQTRRALRRVMRSERALNQGGADWKLQMKTRQTNRRPTERIFKILEENRRTEMEMGPGKYDIMRDPLPKKPCSAAKGSPMQSLVPRFKTNKESTLVPSPGSYGIPDSAMIEAKQRRDRGRSSFSRQKDIANSFYSEGSGLPPCMYETEKYNSLSESPCKVVSTRGPYEGLSGDRFKPIVTGWNPVKESLDPSSIYYPDTLDQRFGKRPRMGKWSPSSRWSWPLGRVVCETNAHFNYKPVGPEPTAYNVSKKPFAAKSFNVGKVPFGSRDIRFNAAALANLINNIDTEGPGRYEKEEEEHAHKHWCCRKRPKRRSLARVNRVTPFNRTEDDIGRFTLNLDSTIRVSSSVRPDQRCCTCN